MRRWRPLDLSGIQGVAAQVDEACALLAGHRLLDAAELQSLARSCSARAADLEAFYFDNDLDSRAIAFQKEGLRLRRALAAVPDAADAAAGPAELDYSLIAAAGGAGQ
jgi:hypothetical protein